MKKSIDKRSPILLFMDKKRFEDWASGTFGMGDPNHEVGAADDEVGAVVCSSRAV
jgi:hypothetical protein